MTEQTENKGWFSRLSAGLKKSTNRITEGLTSIVTKRKLDDEMLTDIEDLLLAADVGYNTSHRLVSTLKKKRFQQEVTLDEVKTTLAEDLSNILQPLEQPILIDQQPAVIFMVGVNGSGKTTTTGKLASQWKAEGKKVRIVAADTFRAAAVEQLAVWADRARVPLEKGLQDSDAAALVYMSYENSLKHKDDVLIVDTAGRLHTKSTLMEELKKVVRVTQKLNPDAPHYTLLVLDSNIGQNTIQQVKLFQEAVNVNGLILTKLDGTAKAGIVIQLADTFKLPIFYLGVGEGIEDLRPFNGQAFVENLLGLNSIMNA
ncbi:MAG: signal recognition particle-docking protein FtsY [Candidatus Paracaedibacteraceae bacterium]|nr:signal recognition particle-docking protein FtsY [Candidatus Paracaedibacteraceae bacterium]